MLFFPASPDAVYVSPEMRHGPGGRSLLHDLFHVHPFPHQCHSGVGQFPTRGYIPVTHPCVIL